MSVDTVFDVDGIEYYVITIKYNKKFNIDLYFGRIEERGRTKPSLILTQSLKKVLLENITLRPKDFGEFLSPSTINKLRRRLMKNPYGSYMEWVESTDSNKPKEIRFLDIKNNPEVLIDYLGIKYVLFSARIANNGIILPVGIAFNHYKEYHKHGSSFILTHALVEYVKKNYYRPLLASKELGIDLNSFIRIRKELGYDKPTEEQINIWLAAHLEEILNMTIHTFISNHNKNKELATYSRIKNIKQGLHLLKDFSKSQEKDKRKALHIVRTLDTYSSKNILKKLRTYLSKDQAWLFRRAYRVLMLAEEYNHKIPRGYKAILKKKRLQ